LLVYISFWYSGYYMSVKKVEKCLKQLSRIIQGSESILILIKNIVALKSEEQQWLVEGVCALEDTMEDITDEDIPEEDIEVEGK